MFEHLKGSVTQWYSNFFSGDHTFFGQNFWGPHSTPNLMKQLSNLYILIFTSTNDLQFITFSSLLSKLKEPMYIKIL